MKASQLFSALEKGKEVVAKDCPDGGAPLSIKKEGATLHAYGWGSAYYYNEERIVITIWNHPNDFMIKTPSKDDKTSL